MLRDYADADAEDAVERPRDEEAVAAAAEGDAKKKDASTMPTVRIEGPLGAPAQLYNDYPVIVLVGAG